MATERTQQIERLSGILALDLILGGAAVVMLPFLPALLWAVILAVATKPVFDGLRRRLGGRTGLAASILTLSFFALVALPVAYIGTKFADEVPAIFANVRVFFEHGLPDPPEVVKRVPLVGSWLDETWRSLAHDTGRLFQVFKPYAGRVGEDVLEAGIRIHPQINIGLATSLEYGGLIVPVIRSADSLSLLGAARAVNDLSGRARLRKLMPEEVRDGTFTLTNHGTSGSLFATPIINQP